MRRGKSKLWEKNLFHCHCAFSTAVLRVSCMSISSVSVVICGSLMLFYVTYAVFSSVRTETSLWFPHKEIHIAEETTGIIYTRVGTLIVATIYLQLIQNRYMFRSFYCPSL